MSKGNYTGNYRKEYLIVLSAAVRHTSFDGMAVFTGEVGCQSGGPCFPCAASRLPWLVRSGSVQIGSNGRDKRTGRILKPCQFFFQNPKCMGKGFP